jgi:hypothetical protein
MTSFVASDYANNSALTGIVYIDNSNISNGTLIAHDNSFNIRGLQDTTSNSPTGPYANQNNLYLITLYSDDDNELIKFKYYYTISNQEYLVDLDFTYNFVINGSSGNVQIPTFLLKNSNFINNVIDYQIPKYYSQVLGINYQLNNPFTLDYYTAYCVPTSFASILNYYNEVQNLNIQINYTSHNSSVPETDYLFNYKNRPLDIIQVNDPLKIDLGYMLNTNARGYDISNGSYKGTLLKDFQNFTTFMNIISPSSSFEFSYRGLNNDISYINNSTTITSYASDNSVNNIILFLNDIKNEIVNNRPLLLSFKHWNINQTGEIVNVNDSSVNLYTWGPFSTSSSNTIFNDIIDEEWNGETGENNLGHTVVCVGFLEKYNNSDYLIVQDNVLDIVNSNNTPRYVAIKLDEVDYQNLVMISFIKFLNNSPVNNLNIISDISSSLLADGFTSSLRVYESSIEENIDISFENIVNNVNELTNSNYAVYLENNNIYIKCGSESLNKPLISCKFNLYNNDLLIDNSVNIILPEISNNYILQSNVSDVSYIWIECSDFTQGSSLISTNPLLLASIQLK